MFVQSVVQQHHSSHAVSVADPPPVHSLCDGSGEFTASDSTDDVTVLCHYTLSYNNNNNNNIFIYFGGIITFIYSSFFETMI